MKLEDSSIFYYTSVLIQNVGFFSIYDADMLPIAPSPESSNNSSHLSTGGWGGGITQVSMMKENKLHLYNQKE